jgi:hypothetical protein
MSVTETYEPELLTGDGSETDFDFAFSVFAASDLVVALVDPDTLVATPQTISTHYTVVLNTSTIGGTITFLTAPTDGTLVSIRRAIPITQGTDIPSGGLFREVQIENAFDKAILLIQQLEERMDRALLQNAYATALDLVLPLPEAAKGLAWNAGATALENVELPAAALAAALVAQTAAELAETNAEIAETNAETASAAAVAAAAVMDTLTKALSVAAGHVATDRSQAREFLVAASADFTLDNPTNATDGQVIIWRIKQDATGSRLIALGNKFTVNSEITTVTLSTAANAIDHIGAIYNATDDKFEVVAFSSEQA